MVGMCDDLRRSWRFVRIVDPGETLDLSRDDPSVESFDITALQDFDRALAIDLAEAACRAPLLFADLPIGADSRSDCAAAGASHELGDETDPPDIDVAVFARVSEPLREEGPDVIPVERLDMHAALRDLGRQHRCQRRFARAGKPG